MKFKMNKRGGDKIVSVYWFAILFIIVGGISYMVFSFYGKPYDIRQLEADALTDRVANCISQRGYLADGIISEDFKLNLTERCRLNFEVENFCRWRDEGQFYVEIRVLNFDSGQEEVEASGGNSNLKNFCDLEGKGMPFCLEREFYTVSKGENQQMYKVKILSIIRKTEKNAVNC